MTAVRRAALAPSGGSAGGRGWLGRRGGPIVVDSQLAPLLARTRARLADYLDQGGVDAPTWMSDIAPFERRLEQMARFTRDRPLQSTLRQLLGKLGDAYLVAPGVDLQPHPVSYTALLVAIEDAEVLAQRAIARAVELQATARPLRPAL